MPGERVRRAQPHYHVTINKSHGLLIGGKVLDRQKLRSLVIPDVDEGAEQQELSGGRGSDSKPSPHSLAASTEHKKPDP